MMKKLFITLLFVLAITTLFASPFTEEWKDRKSYIPDQVIISEGNDKYDFGFTRNDDDQYSYSFDLHAEAPLWYAHFDAKGITNRGWRDGWVPGDNSVACKPDAVFHQGRYDSLETTSGLKLRVLEEDFFLHLYPEVGVAIIGNTGWKWGQNGIHKIFGIHTVELPYEVSNTWKPYLMLNGRVNAGYKVKQFGNSNLIAEVEASTMNTLHFQTENQVLARLAFSTERRDLFGIHFGYMYASSLADSPWYTQNLYMQYLTGWRFGFVMDSGFLSFSYTGTPKTGYGYGYLAINALGFFEPRAWKQNDVILRTGKTKIMEAISTDVTISKEVADNLSLGFKNSFIGGTPLDTTEEKTADLNHVVRRKRNYASMSLKLRYTLPEFLNGYITPYVEAGAGLQIFRIDILKNQTAGNYRETVLVPSEGKGNEYFGLLNAEAGLTLFPKNLLVVQNTSFQIEVFGGYNIFLGDTKTISDYRYASEIYKGLNYNKNELLTHFCPYAGVALSFGFDI